MKKLKIFTIVLGYNNKAYLKDCFDSLIQSNYQNNLIIYIDNYSSDGSVDYIRKHYSQVFIIKNKDNYGFAKGNNIGIDYALKNGADAILLLNPDTIIDENCLSRLVDNFSQNTILQPLILVYSNTKTTKINTTGNYLHFLGMSYCDDLYMDQSIAKNKDITTASGAAMFVPANIFKNVGLLDEDFFMYHEDLDFGWRSRISGYNIRLIANALVWHKYSFSRNKRKYYFIEKNRLLFITKNYQLLTIILILPIIFINELLTIMLSIFGGWVGPKLNSYVGFWAQLPRIIKKRFKISRNKNDYNLRIYINSRIDYAGISLPGINIYNYFLSIYWQMVLKILGMFS